MPAWVQTLVLGIKYGEWGKAHYPGKKPVKTDALDWYVKRITEVRRLIHEGEPTAQEESTATAFVTFRSAWACYSDGLVADSRDA